MEATPPLVSAKSAGPSSSNSVKFSLSLNSTAYISPNAFDSNDSNSNYNNNSNNNSNGNSNNNSNNNSNTNRKTTTGEERELEREGAVAQKKSHRTRVSRRKSKAVVPPTADPLGSSPCLVCNGRVLFETSLLSSSIIEFRAIKVGGNDATTGATIRDSTLSGLDKYDIRFIYMLLIFSFLAFLFFVLFWSDVVHTSHAVLLACVPISIYCAFVLPGMVVEESVTIIQNLGIKITKKYFFGQKIVKFLELDKLESVFMHEYIFRSAVHFSLAMVVEGEKKLILAFHHVYPGFPALREVYKACFREIQK